MTDGVEASYTVRLAKPPEQNLKLLIGSVSTACGVCFTSMFCVDEELHPPRVTVRVTGTDTVFPPEVEKLWDMLVPEPPNDHEYDAAVGFVTLNVMGVPPQTATDGVKLNAGAAGAGFGVYTSVNVSRHPDLTMTSVTELPPGFVNVVARLVKPAFRTNPELAPVHDQMLESVETGREVFVKVTEEATQPLEGAEKDALHCAVKVAERKIENARNAYRHNCFIG